MLKDLQNEGTLISVAGNNPLLLTNPDSIWLVEQGKVIVFAVEVKAEERTGKRNYLFEVTEGNLIFGISPQGRERKFALLASGLPGTKLRQIQKQRFTEIIKDLSDQSTYLQLFNNWVNSLADSVPMDATAAELAVAAETDDANTSFSMLGQYNNAFLQAAIKHIASEEQAEKKRFQLKANVDNKFMSKAVSKLATVTGSEQEHKVIDAESDDPLLNACMLVGQAIKINILPYPGQREGIKSKDPLGDIARASQVRYRQVALKGEWWRNDNGPLLAFMEEDNRPVALIPHSPNKYMLYDYDNKGEIIDDVKIAENIKPLAYTFYRPFPNKIITIKDLLTFGIESCWKRDFVSVLLMGLLGGLLGMVTPVATGIVFDSIIPQGQRLQLLQIAFFLGASALATMLFELTRSFAMLRLEGKIEGGILAALWDRLLSLPTSFFKQYSSGELAMRAMGISEIRAMLSGVAVNTIITSTFSVFNLALLFYYDVQLAVLAVLLVLSAVIVTATLGYIKIRYDRQVLDAENKIAGLVLQLIQGVSKFKVAGAEKRAFYLWSKEFSQQAKLDYKAYTVSNLLVTFNSIFPIITSMIIFYSLVANSDVNLGPGQFIAFNAAFTVFVMGMVALSDTILSVNAIIPIYERVKTVLDELPEYDDAKSNPGTLTGDIEVSHLSFRYKKDSPLVLDDVSLQIKKGEYVGLVGTSGSGKSTLFRILLGFETPETGKVYYDGKDLDKIDIRSVRKQLGVVLQNGQLMSGDIFTNIVGSNPHLTMKDAEEAATMAGLDKDIEQMPMGMHTVISEGGGTFSGGQRQRLLIARAIVNKPKILYFDEATSALDNTTQTIVSESLDKLKATRVVIAHRLSTIINCDRIIVMDKGKIVETGTYDELMQKDGIFAELAKRQLA
ncbi:MAG: NHLP bacteriocin export ABC transporter permease/ATPase subunit [Firmicutes bacterium]|nr:NHLP bacteriocin export ABC transporter permease/ATPase subunit [Bacillota bacterium]